MVNSPLFETEQADSALIVIFNKGAGTCPESELLKQLALLVQQFEGPAISAAVFDLGGVPYFSSILLGALVSFWKQVRDAGSLGERKMVLCNPSKLGREILELSRFQTLWPIFDSRDEALKAVQHRSQ